MLGVCLGDLFVFVCDYCVWLFVVVGFLLRVYCVCLVRLFCCFGDWWLLLLLCYFDLSGLDIAVIAYLLVVAVWVFICLGVCVYVGCYFCWCCCLCLRFVTIVLDVWWRCDCCSWVYVCFNFFVMIVFVCLF